MAATPSTMLALGTRLPDFELPDLNGKRVSSAGVAAPAILVVFICPHCPFVRHTRTEIGRFCWAKTKLTLRQSALENAASRDSHSRGWTSTLERVGNFLEQK